ncbi:putative transcription factor C2H2 family [Helianthus annuus]|uniref:Putative C2H2 and C2HC zinc fingers superfamily protein n=1 Tax=Helianthus annuus TaxID=4232 RepID=A0A251U2K8_HELAN|nr:putative transcription factor C2H2 family [Helianthus annuus]KAJ0763750.1 putative transcription factor C2H2 family [Helianthus annuus]KAJ0900480.1 putative transcription factor C2H2 family [Helianthus annuus]
MYVRNPLDLNNLPDDFSRDQGKQTLDDSSSSASGIYRKNKNGAKDESGKVYECRFCSLKFGKSQALGGHMNRHRQERETEALNHARQLVFSNDNLLPPLPHQLGGQPMVHGGFHHQQVYPTKLFSDTSTTILPPQPPPHMYTSSASRLNNPYPMNDYFVGHVCSGNAPPFTLQNMNGATAPPPESANNYTCIGAPVGQSFTLSEGSGGREMSQSPARRYHQDGF